VQNLLQWGGALLEHAQFQPIPEAKLMLDGISFFLQIIVHILSLFAYIKIYIMIDLVVDVDAAITRWRWWRRSRSFLKC